MTENIFSLSLQLQRHFHDPDVLLADRVDDLHVRQGGPRVVGLAEHRRGNAETARQHKEQEKGKLEKKHFFKG